MQRPSRCETHKNSSIPDAGGLLAWSLPSNCSIHRWLVLVETEATPRVFSAICCDMELPIMRVDGPSGAKVGEGQRSGCSAHHCHRKACKDRHVRSATLFQGSS